MQTDQTSRDLERRKYVRLRIRPDLGITPQQFLNVFNPMYRKGEELLGRYVTELPQPAEGHARILLINNSSLPFTEDGANPLGVSDGALIDAVHFCGQRAGRITRDGEPES